MVKHFRHQATKSQWKPVVLINYGVAREFSDEPSITMLKPTSSPEAGYLEGDWLMLPPAFQAPKRLADRIYGLKNTAIYIIN
jgi:hypothetical protein